MSSDSAVIPGVFMAPGPFVCDETTTHGSTRKSETTFSFWKKKTMRLIQYALDLDFINKFNIFWM